MISKRMNNYTGNDISGFYRAIVEDNKDPLQIGRIRVRMPMLHGVPNADNSLTTDKLPWAMPLSPTGAGFDHGTVIIPEVGDIVFIVFEDKDQNYPLYLGGCYGKGGNSKSYGSKDNPTLFNGKTWDSPPKLNELPSGVYNSEGYPTGKIIYKSPKGATIMIEEKDGKECLKIIDRLGQSIRFSSPVRAEPNSHNAYRRGTGDAYDGTAQDPIRLCENGIAEIAICDAAKQSIKMSSSPTGAHTIIQAGPNGSVRVTLDADGAKINTGGTEVRISPTGEITLSGQKNISLSANTIDLDTRTCIIRGDLINYGTYRGRSRD